MSVYRIYDAAGRGADMREYGFGLVPQGSTWTLASNDGDTATFNVQNNPYLASFTMDYTASGQTWTVSAIRAYNDEGALALDLRGLNRQLTLAEMAQGGWIKFNLSGNDTISGNRYSDWLRGQGGNDRINGNGGNDTLLGDNGNDVLNGGLGADRLTGGLGKDAFVFDRSPTSGQDNIRDFNVKDDTIRIDNADFTKIGSTGVLKSSAFWASNSGVAHDKNDRIVYDKDDGILYYDADGSGAGEAVAFAKISKNLPLSFQDILVI